MRGTRAVLVLVAALAVLTVAGPVAGAQASFDLSAAGQDADSPQVAVDSNGDAHYTWRRFNGDSYIVQTRTVAADGTLGDVQDLSAEEGHAYSPQVAVAPDGTAHYTWYHFDGFNNVVQARTVTADGTPGDVQDLSATGQDAQAPQVAVDSDGNAHYTWARRDGDYYIVQARTVTADGTLGDVQDLSATGQDAQAPQVAVDSDGNAHYTWARSDGDNNIVQARTVTADGTLGDIQDLSDTGANANGPQVAVDPDGNAHYTWSRSSFVQARTVAADGTLGDVQNLSTTGANANDPQVAVDSGGNAHYTWERFPTGDNFIVQARTVTADGTLGDIQDLSATSGFRTEPQVGVDPDGNAHYTWYRHDGTNQIVQARTVAADGTLGDVQNLSAAGQDAADAPQVAVGSDGRAHYTWRGSDGTNYIVQGADVAADTTAPAASIDSGPSGTTNSNHPSFGFSSEAGATFRCKLDGPGAATGSYAACTSPKGYSNLADGSYTFSVKATDQANNTGTAATRSFTVDTSTKPPAPSSSCPAGTSAGVSCSQEGGKTVITGTAGKDTIVGTGGPDVIRGGGGDDHIDCGAGNDRADGGAGADTVNCGAGNDVIHGDHGLSAHRRSAAAVAGTAGDDRINGGSGNDRIDGNGGNDRLAGSSGRDSVSGNSGRDRVSGNSGNDRLNGNSGNDRVSGGSGRDRVKGSFGNDRLTGGTGRDRLLAGSGRDRLNSRDRSRDRVNGGSGSDSAKVDRLDKTAHIEKLARR